MSPSCSMPKTVSRSWWLVSQAGFQSHELMIRRRMLPTVRECPRGPMPSLAFHMFPSSCEQLANSNSIDVAQRDHAVGLIDVTSRMFKTVSQDRQTTAALQGEFLERLVADQTHRISMGPEVETHNTHAWQTGPIYGATTSDEGAATGPNLDFNDFESWLSSFESSTIPELNSNTFPIGARGLNEQTTAMSGADTPSMTNTDWDAVSSLSEQF